MTIRKADHVLYSWLLDSALLVLSLSLASGLRSELPLGPDFAPASSVPAPIYIVVLAVWGVFYLGLGMRDPVRLTCQTEALRIVGVYLIMALVLAALLYFTTRDFSRYLFLYFAVFSLGSILGWRFLVSRFMPPPSRRPGRVAIVGTGPEAVALYHRIHTYSDSPLTVVGFIAEDDDPIPFALPAGCRLLGDLAQLPHLRESKPFDEVVIAVSSSERKSLARVVAAVEQLRVRVYLYFQVQGVVLLYQRGTVGPWHLVDLPSTVIDAHEWLIKRLMDLLVASLLLLLVSPVMALIALAIKLDSPGPAIFRQRRIGEHGRPFILIKFRTMIDGAEAQQDLINKWPPTGSVVHKGAGDPRVTRMGRFLRRWSLDELPQFWNVLRGDMSLVGPRPELPWIVEHYFPDDYQRFLVPPGLTGFWQVNERSVQPMYLAVGDDMYYIKNYSLWLDLWILLKTPLAVLRGRGAY
jgi:exopolysaccharide biosynthesis polyprenyl glycosylphosphotransferase